MTEPIEKALEPLGLRVFDYFFNSANKYKNAEGELITISEYITYQTIMETPITYADDIDEYTEKQIDVDLFTQDHAKINNYKIRIRDALRAAGYTITDTVVQYEADTRYWHATVTVSLIEKTETITE